MSRISLLKVRGRVGSFIWAQQRRKRPWQKGKCGLWETYFKTLYLNVLSVPIQEVIIIVSHYVLNQGSWRPLKSLIFGIFRLFNSCCFFSLVCIIENYNSSFVLQCCIKSTLNLVSWYTSKTSSSDLDGIYIVGVCRCWYCPSSFFHLVSLNKNNIRRHEFCKSCQMQCRSQWKKPCTEHTTVEFNPMIVLYPIK